MNDIFKKMFMDNPWVEEEADAFCLRDPAYQEARREFYEAAHEIFRLVGYERYSCFEERLHTYLAQISELYYLHGLGLRQEVLSALRGED